MTTNGTVRPEAGARGTAGRRGDDVRSDVWIGLEVRDDGGRRIDLRSRVETYYGEAIREQLSAGLERLGIAHARLEVLDEGALPFVIDARLEAAARRAGVRPAAGPDRPPPRRGSSPDRVRRSRLYLPGNEPKYMINAGLHRPDGVILDLEDSVHPQEKDAARLLVRNALRAVDFGDAERMVRINQLPLGLEDLEAVLPERPDLILIPKVERAEQVAQVEAVVERLGDGDGEPGPPWLMPILESALGIEHSFEIARSARRIVALTLGLEDYAADLGVTKTAGGDESLYARTRVVNAARAAGLQAIDSVFGQVDDAEGLRRWASRSRALGFAGMGCVHPRQIAVIHEAFAPTAEEIERARRIVEAFERASAEGLGVVSLGSKMIDPPVIRQAQRVMEQARRAGRAGTAEES